MDIKELFLEQPAKEYHVREVARLAGVAPTTASKKLEELREAGVVVKEEKYNHHLYRAGTGEMFVLERKSYMLRKHGADAMELLNKSKAEAVILTEGGLVAIGGTGSFRGAKVVSVREIEAMKRKDPAFLNALVNGMTLAGEWKVFK